MSQSTILVCCTDAALDIDEFFHGMILTLNLKAASDLCWKVKAIVRPGETLSSTRYERRAGGKGANQAVALAQAGSQVTLVGATGLDGDWVIEELHRLGVDTSKVITSNEASFTLSTSFNEVISIYYRSRSFRSRLVGLSFN